MAFRFLGFGSDCVDNVPADRRRAEIRAGVFSLENPELVLETRESAREKEEKIKQFREEARWWEPEIERLEGVLGVVQGSGVRDQILHESPASELYGTRKTRWLSSGPNIEEGLESKETDSESERANKVGGAVRSYQTLAR
ncbi:unnamed protein product [Diplocarpon coronariae]